MGEPARGAAVVAAVALAVTVAGCGDPAAGSGRRPLVVAAAASLTEVVGELARDFESAHPEVDVRVDLDSSSVLATRILEGAPVDVFASADTDEMARLVDAGLVAGEPAVVAHNRLVVVTPPDNPAGIRELADLGALGAGEVVALCAEAAPCGRLAAETLRRAGVQIDESRVTRGQNVKATLAAVRDGDAVAAIVYVSDAVAAGDAVTAVAVPADANVTTALPVAVLESAPAPGPAREFVDLLRSAEGRSALRRHGFTAP